jgi:hypothetical protein
MLHKPSNHVDAQIEICTDVVVIRIQGSSTPTVAGILGIECDAGGQPSRVYLDRLVHRPYQKTFGGWRVEGAVSTILAKSA